MNKKRVRHEIRRYMRGLARILRNNKKAHKAVRGAIHETNHAHRSNLPMR